LKAYGGMKIKIHKFLISAEIEVNYWLSILVTTQLIKNIPLPNGEENSKTT
jgi:hypothetical protein